MKKIFALIALCLLCIGICFPAAVFAEPSQNLLVDEADVLSDDQEETLKNMLYDASGKYNADIIAVLTDETGIDPYDDYYDEKLQEYSDYYFLNNGYGQGADAAGILFMVDTAGRGYHFSTHGENGFRFYFTDGAIAQLGEDVTAYLRNSDWGGAVEKYCDDVTYMVNYKDESGNAYVPSASTERKSGNALIKVVIAIIVGLIGAFAITKGMKNQLQTVKPKFSASDYFDPRELKLRGQKDTFLYFNVTKVPINTDNKSGGGFSSHSTGGSTFGGGGGRF